MQCYAVCCCHSEKGKWFMTRRTAALIVSSIVLAVLWLVALEVSSFNILVVSLGLMVALFLNPQSKRAHR
jgi:predicted phage tail protein